jgi:hypothetical protein
MVYNPGGQIGKSVQGGGQKPAKDPDGPFLGKSAQSSEASPESKKAGAKKPDHAAPTGQTDERSHDLPDQKPGHS